MKDYITRHQPNKGYIPSDKVRISSDYFEKFSFTHIPEIQKIWLKVSNDYKEDVYQNNPQRYGSLLETVIKEFLKYCEEKGHTVTKTFEGKKLKYFYFNFNHDGIDIFINRGL